MPLGTGSRCSGCSPSGFRSCAPSPSSTETPTRPPPTGPDRAGGRHKGSRTAMAAPGWGEEVLRRKMASRRPPQAAAGVAVPAGAGKPLGTGRATPPSARVSRPVHHSLSDNAPVIRPCPRPPPPLGLRLYITLVMQTWGGLQSWSSTVSGFGTAPHPGPQWRAGSVSSGPVRALPPKAAGSFPLRLKAPLQPASEDVSPRPAHAPSGPFKGASPGAGSSAACGRSPSGSPSSGSAPAPTPISIQTASKTPTQTLHHLEIAAQSGSGGLGFAGVTAKPPSTA